jgi:hypothetical protein
MAFLLVATAGAEIGGTLTGVLESGKAASVTPKPAGPVLAIRKWDPKSPPPVDISPKFVALGASPKIRNASGDWIIVSRSILKADFSSYVAAAKGAGTTGPCVLLEFSRRVQPTEEDLTMVLECAADAGILDIWLATEPPAPPRKLPVNPARPVAPRR